MSSNRSIGPFPLTAMSRLAAVIRFSGVATDALVAEKELRDWLAKCGTKSSGSATYYNAPFTPGTMRRNEVWLQYFE